MGYLGSESTSGTILYQLKQLYDDKKDLEDELDSTNEIINDLDVKAKITNSEWKLTDDELTVIGTLNHDIDYKNTNIFTTTIDTTVSKLDR